MKKNLVVQANALIEARYKQVFSVQELRTVLWVISEIHQEDRFKTQKYEHKSIEISAQRYAQIMGVSVKNIYRDAEKIADSLGSKRFTLQTPTGWINLGWISSMEYKKGEGIIKVLVAPDLLPYIIELKEGNFTSFLLENILAIGSGHAIKIYQLLTQCLWKGGEKVIGIEELRAILGVSDTKSYLEYKNFKKRILEIAKREINEKTDISMSYSEIKKGRKVEAIKFKITQKKKTETKLDETTSN